MLIKKAIGAALIGVVGYYHTIQWDTHGEYLRL